MQVREYIIKFREGRRDRYLAFTDGHEWKVVVRKEDASRMELPIALAMIDVARRKGKETRLEMA